MGRFLLGLIIGLILGVLAVTYNPQLPEEIRAAAAEVTALVMRGTERAAEAVGEAADEVADEAREADGGTAEQEAEPSDPVPAPE